MSRYLDDEDYSSEELPGVDDFKPQIIDLKDSEIVKIERLPEDILPSYYDSISRSLFLRQINPFLLLLSPLSKEEKISILKTNIAEKTLVKDLSSKTSDEMLSFFIALKNNLRDSVVHFQKMVPALLEEKKLAESKEKAVLLSPLLKFGERIELSIDHAETARSLDVRLESIKAKVTRERLEEISTILEVILKGANLLHLSIFMQLGDLPSELISYGFDPKSSCKIAKPLKDDSHKYKIIDYCPLVLAINNKNYDLVSDMVVNHNCELTVGYSFMLLNDSKVFCRKLAKALYKNTSEYPQVSKIRSLMTLIIVYNSEKTKDEKPILPENKLKKFCDEFAEGFIPTPSKIEYSSEEAAPDHDVPSFESDFTNVVDYIFGI